MTAYKPLTEKDLQERIKELQERIDHMGRRKKTLEEFKTWMHRHKLEVSDVRWMLNEIKPRKSRTAYVSKKNLQPPAPAKGTKPAKGDPAFRAAIRQARLDAGLSTKELGKKIGKDGSSIGHWESGRYLPSDESRKALLKILNLPMTLVP